MSLMTSGALSNTPCRMALSSKFLNQRSTKTLSVSFFHRCRGRVAIDEFGVLAGYPASRCTTVGRPIAVTKSLTSSVGHHLFRGPWAAFEDGQSWAEELSTLLCATHERVEAAKVAETTAPPTRTLNSLARRHDELNIAGHAANSLPTRTHRPG